VPPPPRGPSWPCSCCVTPQRRPRPPAPLHLGSLSPLQPAAACFSQKPPASTDVCSNQTVRQPAPTAARPAAALARARTTAPVRCTVTVAAAVASARPSPVVQTKYASLATQGAHTHARVLSACTAQVAARSVIATPLAVKEWHVIKARANVHASPTSSDRNAQPV